MKPYVVVNDLTWVDGEGHLGWENHKDLQYPGGGTREAALLIEIDVDGQLDLVYGDLGQVGDINAIERAMVILQRLHVALTDCNPEGKRWVGTCMKQSDDGRCLRIHGHSAGHKHRWDLGG